MSITIEQLNEQLARAVAQRDQYLGFYQQTCGAVQVIQDQIKMIVVNESVQKEKEDKQAESESQNQPEESAP
jgi:hypothetical protein